MERGSEANQVTGGQKACEGRSRWGGAADEEGRSSVGEMDEGWNLWKARPVGRKTSLRRDGWYSRLGRNRYFPSHVKRIFRHF